ncbi:c-type cytochrome [Methylocella silvestris]|nr:cytochrome c [Methylocella silvestris]
MGYPRTRELLDARIATIDVEGQPGPGMGLNRLKKTLIHNQRKNLNRIGRLLQRRLSRSDKWKSIEMIKFNPFAIALLAPLAVLAAASAQAADPAVGRQLAEQVCSECHQVGPVATQQPANSTAPSFLDISRMSSTSELAIKVFLRSSHPTMPNIILDQEETDSIAAYILGLAKH